MHISRGNFRLGVLYGAFGVGAVLGSLASATMHKWLETPELRSALFLIAGASGAATFLSPTWIASAVGVSLWACCYIAIMISTITVRQLSTPAELQGRVNIVGRSISLGVGWPLGAGAAGLIATHWGARASLVACMIPLCAVGLYGLRHTKKPIISDA
jgi:predicted MFS family arabinose efflux permease